MKPTKSTPTEDPVRPHVYDGIQEYDKKLPNWWLNTLYITILFWVGYWGYYEWFQIGRTGEEAVTAAMAKVESDRLSVAQLDDSSLWKMSRNPTFVSAGKIVYDANCAACHLVSLRGKTESVAAIGPDLTDTLWVHGGNPVEVYDVIAKGILTKGMPTWGPVLGSRKISEVTAYILSKHKEGEPVVRAQVASLAGQ